MLSEEIKRIIDLSGGKLVFGDGELSKSYVVMKLDQYLKERADTKGMDFSLDNQKDKKDFRTSDLTGQELLDRINAEIDQQRRKQNERNLENLFKEDDCDYDYDYLS